MSPRKSPQPYQAAKGKVLRAKGEGQSTKGEVEGLTDESS
jgi:hypothetical protein